ncbi:transglutaminase domain-containing protein [Candidatus Woesearchaeota archaeon]|jgi:hypothetical protein|nr:transglutaminase domain-containing protein [Candidatus Woesearchaeota archaeon]MBT4150917.1 transglutaminase domain-containing protein [Candidatus Woesearchaeota archaeon]MBT4247108.1 transglutaminase domain-containing protein [Candidatus Woesearchaeota archaeon]MBT4433707.1 transglutaminase domain-containing protein [Candidatus Woesearchaeota archaeon]MBT7332458.1 transglutaminase domain-containing protein [Candidatus Woesearchaeota archaeon]
MKRGVFLLVLLLCISTVSAASLYDYDQLVLELEVDGSFDLIPTQSGGTIKQVKTNLLLFPKDNFRQTIVNIDTEGIVEENHINYIWTDKRVEEKQYGYEATVQTKNKRNKVSKKIAFPISKEKLIGFEQYTEPTETIDSNDINIIKMASELAEGEDDLFKVSFKLAEWVEKNIKYDLNTLTASASQTASWTLENKNGVCDEMTSLFVAMARSLGIPARFASGISYSTSDLFDEPWQPHGWGEVYFPEVGWVGFDITFGEYGYVDVTHIKLRDGFDPKEPATEFEWFANNIDLEAKNLDFNVKVLDQGTLTEDEIVLSTDVHASKIGFNSYNRVKGIIINNENYYQATTLQLAVPKEVEIIERNRRTILLAPGERKETYWTLKLNDKLDQKYWYEFPISLYSEKNNSISDSFRAEKGEQTFSFDEIKQLEVKNEDKTYSQKISFDCNMPKSIQQNELLKIPCTIKNTGNKNLKNINFCIENICEIVNLAINQKITEEITVKTEDAGWQKVFVSAENGNIEKRESYDYQIVDKPLIITEVILPKNLEYGKTANFKIDVRKESFAIPKEVKVSIKGPKFENAWNLNDLNDKQELTLQLNDPPFSFNNKIVIEISWKDEEGNEYNKIITENLKVNSERLEEKLKMFFNIFLKLF